jgi:4-amino-4-deoxy-L-arabinose transferase-like glycosyltransferase
VIARRLALPLLLAALSLLVNLIWVFTIQPFLAPDEPEHIATVREIQRKAALPELHFDFTSNPKGEPQPPFDDQRLTDAVQEVLGTGDRHRISFENVQSPFYYVTAALVSWPVVDNVPAELYICRVVSALFGMVTVLFIWAAVRELSPDKPLFALFCATTILFLPQFAFNSAYVTNDVALNAVGACALFVWLKGLRNPSFDRYLLVAGAVTGLAVLTKLTALVLLLPLGMLVIHRAESVRHFLALIAGACASFFAVTGWWFIRNIVVYGEWTGFANAMRFHILRKGTVLLDPTNPDMVGQYFKTTFESSVGLFGWMDVPLDQSVYAAALWLGGALSVLSLYQLFRRIQVNEDRPFMVRSLSVLLLLGVCITLGYLSYSLRVGYQAQGRYLFLLLLPFTLLINYGLYSLIERRAWNKLWCALPTVLLLALNVGSVIIVANHWV